MSELLGDLLNGYTPDAIKTEDDIEKLQMDIARKSRELHLLGISYGGTGSPLTEIVYEYCDALRQYLTGDMKRSELEQRRAVAKRGAQEVIAKIKNAS